MFIKSVPKPAISIMYEVERKQSPDCHDDYVYTAKNENGQILVLEVYLRDWKLSQWYSVAFHIATKRKRGYETLQQTGTDGLKSLIWAKTCLKDFINSYKGNIKIIRITADDNRRFRVYQRSLKDIGFVKYCNKNILIKKLNP
jgi:hypothetical protein